MELAMDCPDAFCVVHVNGDRVVSVLSNAVELLGQGRVCGGPREAAFTSLRAKATTTLASAIVYTRSMQEDSFNIIYTLGVMHETA